jgi:hypothetical protein
MHTEREELKEAEIKEAPSSNGSSSQQQKISQLQLDLINESYVKKDLWISDIHNICDAVVMTVLIDCIEKSAPSEREKNLHALYRTFFGDIDREDVHWHYIFSNFIINRMDAITESIEFLGEAWRKRIHETCKDSKNINSLFNTLATHLEKCIRVFDPSENDAIVYGREFEAIIDIYFEGYSWYCLIKNPAFYRTEEGLSNSLTQIAPRFYNNTPLTFEQKYQIISSNN